MREPTGKIRDNPVTDNNNELDDLEDLQHENEDIANIESRIKVNGKVIDIKSRTIPQLVRIDRAVLEFQKIMYDLSSGSAEDLTEEEAEARILERQDKCMEAVSNVLYYIINEDYDNPEFTRDWIINNIPLTDMNKIIDTYNEKNSLGEFLKKTAMARKL